MTERMDAIGKAARDNLGTGHADRAPVLWFGGKGKLARKIVPLLPRGRVYVEPFMGAASVFFHLPRPRPVEVLNDIDGELVNLFRVLQCPDTFRSFCHRVTWTPYARAEFIRALQSPMDADPVAGVGVFRETKPRVWRQGQHPRRLGARVHGVRRDGGTNRQVAGAAGNASTVARPINTRTTRFTGRAGRHRLLGYARYGVLYRPPVCPRYKGGQHRRIRGGNVGRQPRGVGGCNPGRQGAMRG